MACYHPLKAFPIGYTDSGKIDYKVCDFAVDHIERNKNGVWIKCYDSFIGSNNNVRTRHIEVPCGKCIGCRLERSREWANRCMMELKYHEESWFLTLTYDDEHLPMSESVDPETGEIRQFNTLVKKDWQDFMKRLRKAYAEKYDNKLRFFMCGEYGESTKRCHYHAILFGLHLDDLEVYSKSELGYTYYNSQWLSDIWKKGFVVVAPVTWETCAYTARYVMKKLNGPAAEIYDEWNIEPEFTLMSRKPGIAAQYYQDHPTIMDYDLISVSTEKGGLSFKAPRYFEKLFDKDHPSDTVPFYELYDSLDMQIIRDMQKSKLQRTDKNYQEYLKTEEGVKSSSIKALKRKGV